MKTYRVNGSHIKRLRELLRSGATQKEFAFAVGISERQLRNIENNSAIIKRDVLDRLARHLSVEVKEIAYAVDGPCLVPSPSIDDAVAGIRFLTGDYLQPRYDTEYASATMDADELFKHACGSQTVVCTIETKLTAELSGYACEIMELLGTERSADRALRALVSRFLAARQGVPSLPRLSWSVGQLFPRRLTMADEYDDEGLHEFSGKIIEWSGRTGMVLTHCGKRLPLGCGQLKALGFSGPVKLGDRIHLYATERVEVSYHIDRIRLIIPGTSEPVSPVPSRTKSRLRRDLEPDEHKKVFSGVIETFNPEKGYGYIRASCGELLLLHITCLRASGYRTAPIGVSLTCEALRRARGWQAVRLISTHGKR